MTATSPAWPTRRRLLSLAASVGASLGAGAALSACAALPPPVVSAPAPITSGAFVVPDGTRLPFRAWMPARDAGTLSAGEPWAVALALHGFNESRDAWELPAPSFQAAGIALYAPDQRGFGATATRGRWAGVDVMAGDIVAMTRALRARHPQSKLVLMGESMGGALLMHAAVLPDPPPADAWVLLAPAVWGRAEMGILLSSGLWIVAGVAPWWQVTGREVPIRVRASDNRAALIRLARDPLTIRATRFDALRGLTDAMDAAQAAAPRFQVPSLVLYGAKDELVPPEAMAALWRKLPPAPRRALYPNGYHLLLRDLGRAAPIGDVIAWLRDPDALLPSGADIAASAWLAGQA